MRIICNLFSILIVLIVAYAFVNCNHYIEKTDTYYNGIIKNTSSNIVIVTVKSPLKSIKTVLLTPEKYNEGGSWMRVFDSQCYNQELEAYNDVQFKSNFDFLSVKIITNTGDTVNFHDSADLTDIKYWQYKRTEYYLEVSHNYYLIIE